MGHPEIHEHREREDLRIEGTRTSKGLHFERKFTRPDTHPYDEIIWAKRDAVISNERGEVVFRQEGVEVPENWSQMATNVVASKYFRGAIDGPGREYSVKQLISRVADTITAWGRADGYFATDQQAEVFNAELISILVNQYAAFNSPVWFNVGVEEQPQCSACFILSVDDDMRSLLKLQEAEAMLFKYGSGAGSNLSQIRSSKERLSSGGSASGPVSFMRGYDAWAGTIKSGGKTRRAAKMQILDVEHPDVMEFITAKRLEEQKAWALIEHGYDGGFNVQGGAYDSVFFQNSNFSVRVTDEFMRAAVDGRKFGTKRRTDGTLCELLDAKEVLKEIAHGTWICGDPGLQFDTIINEWHTCPNSGRINASNPCSEYMHIDDSACNLASINLLKYLRDNGSLDIARYKHTVDILITAQDILIDRSSYPTAKIAKNASSFRQLGLGFANLGALIMAKGHAYDSDDGRALAAALMSVLCGEAYLQSSRIAEKLGAFADYEDNREPMLKVIAKHTQAAGSIPETFSTETLRKEAKAAWHEALTKGRKFGYRNAQTTVLAPTGTIAFFMDCDTTGIEPDIALVKYKKLVGGGLLKIVNQCVSPALKNLGYKETEVKEIIAFIDEYDTIEGAPGLLDEHLSIFDCAFKPQNGSRSIHHSGHLKMMSAVQPFVSGAISKTVNLPEGASVEDIFEVYVSAWELGLKAVAIYRDNSKRSQPLGTKEMNTGDESAPKEDAKIEPIAITQGRRRLGDERQSLTHKFSIVGHEGYITVGLFDDGSPGEIFVVMAKEGSTLSGIMDAFATSISMALQYGVPLSVLVKKFAHMRFEPAGMTMNKDIPFAKSVMDYIFRWMALKFLNAKERQALGVPNVNGENEVTSKSIDDPLATKNDNGKGLAASVKSKAVSLASSQLSEELAVSFQLGEDAPPCTLCGSALMVRQGSCYRCLNCGSQGGCG